MSGTVGFRGIIPPMVTPLAARDQLDRPGLERLIEHLLAGGVHGLFLLGTTGEGPNLSYGARRELITHACRQVAGRVPVLAGITDTALGESLALARHAADAGAAAVVAAPPYYMPMSQGDLLEYVRRLDRELPLPLMLYNMPALTKVVFEPDTVRRAMDLPRVVGLKDSSRNMSYFRQICGLLPDRLDFSLLIGPEEMLAEALTAGAHGGVCGGANVFPSLYVGLYQAMCAGDHSAAGNLGARVARVTQLLYPFGRQPPQFIASLKCALSHMNICNDLMTDPFLPLQPLQQAQIALAIKELREQDPGPGSAPGKQG